MRHDRLHHRFVEFIPESLEEGILYVSIEYRTVTHKCCCGCGSEVVTPLGPADWRLIFDGKTVSLEPSVGSWSLPCQSHYWIRNNQVRWADKWTKEQIKRVRESDAGAKRRYFESEIGVPGERPAAARAQVQSTRVTPSWWDRIKRFFGRT